MHQGFINEVSWKCLLGKQAKNIEEIDNLFFWQVGKKQHMTTNKILTEKDLDILKNKTPCNFHYIEPINLEFLKKHFKIEKTKFTNILINLENFKLQGGEAKKIRQSFNKNLKYNFEILDNFKSIKDVEDLIEEWSNLYTNKYFRDFSGKNLYFYQNNFHKDCLNVFIYDKEKLIAFGTLSQDNDYGFYVLGKALYKRYSGLAEFADILLYQKGIEKNIKILNIGRATKGLIFYKSKFPNTFKEIFYDGKIL